MSQAAECCMKKGYWFVRHHLEPSDTTSPRAWRAAASRLAAMISGLSAALGIRSSVPPKLPLPISSLRSQNPERSGTEDLDGVLCPTAPIPQRNGRAARIADFSRRLRIFHPLL